MIMPISLQYTVVYGVIIWYITDHLDPTNYLLNPYHAEGYLQLVSTSAKHEYSHNHSKCSSMPSGTIVLY